MAQNNIIIANFPSGIKCEFCDITFKCDLDVSRHLVSPNHVKNKETFILNYCRESNIERSKPQNVNEVLDVLKLRCVKDLRDLADKGYFNITDVTTAQLADEMSRVLVRAVIEYESKGLPERQKQTFDSILERQRKIDKDKWDGEKIKQAEMQQDPRGRQISEQRSTENESDVRRRSTENAPDVRQRSIEKVSQVGEVRKCPQQGRRTSTAGASETASRPGPSKPAPSKTPIIPPASNHVFAHPPPRTPLKPSTTQVTPPRTLIYKSSELPSTQQSHLRPPVIARSQPPAQQSGQSASKTKPKSMPNSSNSDITNTMLPASVRPLTTPIPRIDSDYVPILAKIKVEKVSEDENPSKKK